jgi:hypothetical protein
MLMKHGFTSVERHRSDALAFVQHLQPDLVVAVVDPTRGEDLELLGNLSRASKAVLFVIAATNDALAASLRAGADIYGRDTDGTEVLDAQIASLGRRLSLAKGGGEEEDAGRVTSTSTADAAGRSKASLPSPWSSLYSWRSWRSRDAC